MEYESASAYFRVRIPVNPEFRDLEMTYPSNSLLKTLLFKPEFDYGKGRVIRFDENTPDIAYTTGSMRDRVILFLRDNQGYATASEIAKGIASNGARTTKILNSLVEDALVDSIKLEGCVREYCLSQDFAE
jgi:hypothetical protein